MESNNPDARAQAGSEGPADTFGTGLEPVSGLAEQFLQRGSTELRFVDQGQLRAAIGAAIRRALQLEFGGLDSALLDSVAREATATFFQWLRPRSRAARGFSRQEFADVLDQVRLSLVAERDRFRDQLGSLELELAERRRMLSAGQEALAHELQPVSPELTEEEERLLGGRIHELFDQFQEDGGELEDLRQHVTELALESLRAERRKAAAVRVDHYHRQVETLERRIEKLVHSLESTESQLKRLGEMKEVDPGLASIFRTVQGLSEEEANAEVKRQMMAAIFKANLELRETIASNQAKPKDQKR